VSLTATGLLDQTKVVVLNFTLQIPPSHHLPQIIQTLQAQPVACTFPAHKVILGEANRTIHQPQPPFHHLYLHAAKLQPHPFQSIVPVRESISHAIIITIQPHHHHGHEYHGTS